MKVAFDGRVIADRYPGIGRYAYGLAQALASLAEVTLITDPRARNTRFDLSAISAPQLTVEVGPSSLAAQWRIPRAVVRTGAQLYHSPYFLMPYATSARYVTSPMLRFTRYALGITHSPSPPSVVTFFDLVPLLPEAGYGAAARLAIRLAHQLAARSATHVIAPSRWACDSFMAELNLTPENITAIEPGIDPAFRPRPPAEVEAVQAKLSLPPDYLLYVGTLRPHKNLARLIEAVGRLPPESPPLVVAGHADPRFAQARVAAASLAAGRICFVEAVAESDLPALYSGATLFVFPSLAEGFGLPVLEAMACGAPVACSTSPGLDEAAGHVAARFDPRSADAMAETLAALLRDRERRTDMSQRGLERAASFTWGRAAERTLRVYENVVSGS